MSEHEITQADRDRFWAKVDQTGECWEWTATKIKDGYGMIRWAGRTQLANRVSLELAGLPAPFDKAVCRHNCDNPSCVNPAHLEWGTQRQNMQDAMARGRIPMAALEARHARLRAMSVAVKCGHCDKIFSSSIGRVRLYKALYCSRSCQNAWQASKPECHAGHAFTEENTYRSKNGVRHCRTCNRHRAEKHRAKKRDAEVEEWFRRDGLRFA